jgi:hypothetical protein
MDDKITFGKVQFARADYKLLSAYFLIIIGVLIIIYLYVGDQLKLAQDGQYSSIICPYFPSATTVNN